jgi:peptidoglycan-associated lipoprotein
MKTTILLLAVAAAGAGCSKDKPAAVKTTPDVAVKPDKPDPPPLAIDKDTQISPGIAMSGDLATMCNIKAAAARPNPTTPQFDYDKDELTPDDRTALDQLATCLTTGPLKGKAVALIGRADPRGTEEYNLGLGSRRAASVGQYLGRLGVAAPQLAVSTRGALEAAGTDEASWKQDRRVDIQLKTN